MNNRREVTDMGEEHSVISGAINTCYAQPGSVQREMATCCSCGFFNGSAYMCDGLFKSDSIVICAASHAMPSLMTLSIYHNSQCLAATAIDTCVAAALLRA